MWHIEFDIIDEIEWGIDMKMRLIETHRKKNQSVQIWSSLSKQWNTMYRYKVEEKWKWWKNYAELYIKRCEDKQAV